MVEQIIKIDGMTLETAKSGNTYNQFRTSIGKIGVFEDDVVSALSQHIGVLVRVNVETRPNGYKNITQFLGVAPVGSVPSVEAQAQPNQMEVTSQPLKPKPSEVVKHEIVSSDWVEVGRTPHKAKIYNCF